MGLYAIFLGGRQTIYFKEFKDAVITVILKTKNVLCSHGSLDDFIGSRLDRPLYCFSAGNGRTLFFGAV